MTCTPEKSQDYQKKNIDDTGKISIEMDENDIDLGQERVK